MGNKHTIIKEMQTTQNKERVLHVTLLFINKLLKDIDTYIILILIQTTQKNKGDHYEKIFKNKKEIILYITSVNIL